MNRELLIHLELNHPLNDGVEHLIWILEVNHSRQLNAVRLILRMR